jgi:preprotein translocase subunit YajC
MEIEMEIGTIGFLVLMVVAMYFLMIRPGRKQQQKQRDMMAALQVGSRVMLGSGIYGTIRHLGEKQAIIEISPGVDLTVMRAAIRNVVGPDEEEFEYAEPADRPDEADPDAPAPLGTEDPLAAYEADLAATFAPQAEAAAGDEDAPDQPDSNAAADGHPGDATATETDQAAPTADADQPGSDDTTDTK